MLAIGRDGSGPHVCVECLPFALPSLSGLRKKLKGEIDVLGWASQPRARQRACRVRTQLWIVGTAYQFSSVISPFPIGN